MAAGYHYGVKLRITPTGLSPASAAASLAALPPPALPGLRGTTSPSATLPARPAPHGVPVGVCAPPTGLPVLLPSPSFHACHRQYPGGTGRCVRRSLPGQWQPSPAYGRVGSRIPSFEACSAFTHVVARMVAGPPTATRLVGVLQAMSLPPQPAPIATGWSDSCRAGFAPAEGRCLSTAHRKRLGSARVLRMGCKRGSARASMTATRTLAETNIASIQQVTFDKRINVRADRACGLSVKA